MPIYSYVCDSCGIQFERSQKFTDRPIKRCPECSKSSVRRVIQPAGIIFRGSGWYKTDSRSASSASIEPGKGKKPETKPAESSSPAASTSADE